MTDDRPADQTEPHAADGRRWWTRGLALALAIVLLVAFAPAVWIRAVAFATVADGLDLPVPRPFAPDVQRRATSVAGIDVDQYLPSGTGGTPGEGEVIVLVPGATPPGRDDTRVVALSQALARAHRMVVVPELEVYQEDLVPEDIDRLVRVVDSLADDHGPVVVAGISFGGSLSLLAAAGPRMSEQVALVATFGAYADLGGVVQAATTGVSLVGDRRIPWEADPRAADVVRDQLLGLLREQDRGRVEQALDDDLDPSQLSTELHTVYALLVNDDPARTPGLMEQLPDVVLERVDAVSPVRAAADLDVAVVALHATDDPVIPYGELGRLGSAYPDADLLTLRTFDHVGLTGEDQGWWVTVRDLWQTTRFVTRVLRAE